ncbi:MAG TPA: hypothetical protein QF564_13910 [Pirellulaceae bacterium]|nr:hypothetical protein [Pirellulaceae bacterium]
MNGATAKPRQVLHRCCTERQKAVGPLGFEPRLTDSESTRIRVFHEENAHSQQGAAQGAAFEHENAPIDPDLQAIIDRWPDLSEAVKVGILAMVKAADDAPRTS